MFGGRGGGLEERDFIVTKIKSMMFIDSLLYIGINFPLDVNLAAIS